MSGRYAILIGNAEFAGDQASLRPLRCSVNDVEGLNDLLTSDRFGGYTTTKLVNATHDFIRRAIYQSLKTSKCDDLVLIYYSGHGKLDNDGNLYLAAKDTVIDALPPTSIPVSDIKRYAQDALASKIVIVLDCCFSGAVGKLYKGEIADQASRAIGEMEGQGTFFLTASTDIQLAEEKEGDEYSLLTKYLIAGIKEGKADLDDDGFVSFHELCSYVQSEVPREGSQRPKSWSLDAAGDVIVALTGKPAFEARSKAVTKKLYELANQDLLTDETVGRILEIIRQQMSRGGLSVPGSSGRELIESLYPKLNNTGAFVQETVRWTLTARFSNDEERDVGDHSIGDSSPVEKKTRTLTTRKRPFLISGLVAAVVIATLILALARRSSSPPVGQGSTSPTSTPSSGTGKEEQAANPQINNPLNIQKEANQQDQAVNDVKQKTAQMPQKVQMIKVGEAPPPAAPNVKIKERSTTQMGGAVGKLISSAPNVMPKIAPPQRVRVSSGITQGLLIHKVDPVYPPLARQARIQGQVVLQAVIAKDGSVLSLNESSGHPMLIPAAMDAVKQWKYKPYVLNGEPVETETQIIVNFTLGGG